MQDLNNRIVQRAILIKAAIKMGMANNEAICFSLLEAFSSEDWDKDSFEELILVGTGKPIESSISLVESYRD